MGTVPAPLQNNGLSEVKLLRYGPGVHVEFVIRGNTIIYCGTEDIREIKADLNTTNSAAEIASALAEAVGAASPRTLQLFEFGVYRSVSGIGPREYDFHEVHLRSWGVQHVRVTCPSEIVAIFRHHIAGDGIPRQHTPLIENSFRRSLERQSRATNATQEEDGGEDEI